MVKHATDYYQEIVTAGLSSFAEERTRIGHMLNAIRTRANDWTETALSEGRKEDAGVCADVSRRIDEIRDYILDLE